MSVYKIDSRTGITFYKPDFPFLEPDKDVGTNCGLSVAEMNNNFYVLEGNDVLSFILEGNELKLTLKNGMEYKVTLTGGGGGIVYESDGSIIIDGTNIATNGRIIPWCTKDDHEPEFQVTNPVGLYKVGDLIKGDVSIETVLKTMLTKEEELQEVLVTKPFVTLDVKDDVTKEPITDRTVIMPNLPFKADFSYLFKDEPDDIRQGFYSASWLVKNPLDAQCPELDGTKFFIYNNDVLVDEIVANANTIYEKNDGFEEGNVEIKIELNYGAHANEDKPYKSDNETLSEKIIKPGMCEDSIIFKVNQDFPYYFGYLYEYDYETEIEPLIKDWTLTDVQNLVNPQRVGGKEGGTGICNKNGDTKIAQLIGGGETNTIVLALPEKYSNLKQVLNYRDLDVTSDWLSHKYIVNDINGNYVLYIKHIKMSPTRFKEIIFNKF